MAKSFIPQVVTGNDLMDGDVIYLTDAGDWTREHAEAALARSREQAAALLAEAEGQSARVVGPYLADAELDAAGRPRPIHYRERLRTLGPSNRPDLGRQAGHGGA